MKEVSLLPADVRPMISLDGMKMPSPDRSQGSAGNKVVYKTVV